VAHRHRQACEQQRTLAVKAPARQQQGGCAKRPAEGGKVWPSALGRAARSCRSPYTQPVKAKHLANLKHLRRARDLIDRDYARPLEIAELARASLMSSAHFSRQFRAAYGQTPYDYLMTRRIERAMALLRRGDLTVSEVSSAVGRRSLGSFSARLRELVGESPSSYREGDHSVMSMLPRCIAGELTRPTPKRAGLKKRGA
jgi:AraC-like DNA-binding protein